MTTSVYTLDQFVIDAQEIAAQRLQSDAAIAALTGPLARIIARPDCLADFAGNDDPSPEKGFVIHRSETLTALAVVWAEGSSAPIHDHHGWAMEGVVAGVELNRNYTRVDDGSKPWFAELEERDPTRLGAGETTYLADPPADIHAVEIPEGKTVAIHLYGLDLLKQWRFRFDQETGAVTPFIGRTRD
jgi:predicted metal-dependent enzyme (double-stranded beta helix superfamily)